MNARRERLAGVVETLLRTVTTPDQAAAIAGDLVETAEAGRKRLLVDLASAWLFLGTRSIVAAPLAAVGALLGGLVLWSAIYCGIRFTLATLGWLSWQGHGHVCIGSPDATFALLSGALVLAGLCSGSLLSLAGGTRCINPALPIAAVFVSLGPALCVAELVAGTASAHCLLTYLVVFPLFYALPLMLGCLTVMQRRVA